ncbi:MAG: methylmalonyl-CoA mutase family protein [Planctomycetota bacterium]|nr:methylmalonyl-CoA mutase family protein [Planctomycetota bacterium]
MGRTRKEWEEETLKKVLEKFPERKKVFKTTSGIEFKRLYTPEDSASIDYDKEIGFPGEYPFTRGVQPTMYRGRFWTMRQYAGYGTAEETNKRFRYLLKEGQTGLSVAFDLPTQVGYDSDHPLSTGEVGKVGVPISSIVDMERLFEEIPLKDVSTSMTINSTAPIILAMYIAVAKRQGTDTKELRGTVQNDILKEYTARGTFRFPIEPSMRLVTDIFKYCKEKLPQWNTISISGYHIRESGSTAVQEVAFTLANAIAYVEEAIKAGLDVDEFAGRLSFFFGSHNNIFEEVAKFRAARRMWAKIMKERFKAKKRDSMLLRFHTQTAGCTLTAQQFENNVVRVAFQALAAVLGGTQSLHTNSRDEAMALPSEDSVTIALRTQQLIAYESGVADVIDPLGGCPFIESLTNEIERLASEYIKKIEEMGGVVTAIRSGFIQKEIQRSAYEYQKGVESGEIPVVGVNIFKKEGEKEPEWLLRVDPEIERRRRKELEELRKKRDKKRWQEAMDNIKRAAERPNELLMPHFIDAVEAYATVGEICEVLASVFGEYTESEYY